MEEVRGYGSWKERAMKFVDEFREPELIARPPKKFAALPIPTVTTASWKSAADTLTRSTASD